MKTGVERMRCSVCGAGYGEVHSGGEHREAQRREREGLRPLPGFSRDATPAEIEEGQRIAEANRAALAEDERVAFEADWQALAETPDPQALGDADAVQAQEAAERAAKLWQRSAANVRAGYQLAIEEAIGVVDVVRKGTWRWPVEVRAVCDVIESRLSALLTMRGVDESPRCQRCGHPASEHHIEPRVTEGGARLWCYREDNDNVCVCACGAFVAGAADAKVRAAMDHALRVNVARALGLADDTQAEAILWCIDNLRRLVANASEVPGLSAALDEAKFDAERMGAVVDAVRQAWERGEALPGPVAVAMGALDREASR